MNLDEAAKIFKKASIGDPAVWGNSNPYDNFPAESARPKPKIPIYPSEFTGDLETIKATMRALKEQGYSDADISRYLFSQGIGGRTAVGFKREVFPREQVLKPAQGSQSSVRNGIMEVGPIPAGNPQPAQNNPQPAQNNPQPAQNNPQPATNQTIQNNVQTSDQSTGNEQLAKEPKKTRKDKKSQPVDVQGQPNESTRFETKIENGNTGEQLGKDFGTRQPKATKKTPPFLKALKHPGTTAAFGAAGGVASGLLGAAGLYGASKIYNKLFGDSGGFKIVPA